MKKLVVSAFAFAALASTAIAAEPLTNTQLDQVTAAGFQSNWNHTTQVAVAQAYGGCNVAVCLSGFGGNGNAAAIAANENKTFQSNR